MEKLWLSQYQQTVPSEINMNDYTSIVQMFEETCQTFKENIAYTNMGTEISFRELDKLTLQFAAFLQGIGLQKGTRIAIMMPNLLQYPIVLFASLRAGLIVVNTNPLYTSDELIHQINDSEAEAIVVLANFAKTVEKALPKMPSLRHVITTQIGDVFPVIKRLIVNAVVKYVKKMVPEYHIPNAISFNQALQQGKNKTFQPIEINQEDIAFLQYTGGTTGIAKGAILTHGNMISNVLQASAWIKPLALGDQEIIVTALPLYHVFSLTANCLTFLKLGAKNILITNPRDIPHFIKEIKQTGFTAITGVNTLFNALLHHPKFDEIDFSKLKLALAGGMALQKSVSVQWRERTRSRVLEAYGLTETSPAVTINPMYLEEYNGSIGLPLPSTDISIRDEDGHELPVGERGELCVKGPQVMAGYWRRPEETERVFWPDGFLRTGDIATIDEKGFVYLVDRKKDMIVVSGFNVYPNEVEQVINMHPDVLEAGVIGVMDENSGEKVKACIVKKHSSLTEEQIVTHCREHLTAYKVPKIIEFYKELPKSNVGKILRRALR
ncbi:AMP-binding protein [Legionella nagasakiensis]|uniref:AMP-binding protein n=1 Tax=Legionella nagasakiensis TaxID=535290 RepID=UPI00105567CF|nr:AMP-binding protein [Legionella nagasakiensis]